MIVEAISLLPLLEPLAGASFALNLAYLNLERFRYRERIRAKAQTLLYQLEETEYFSVIENMREIELLRELSGLLDYDGNYIRV